jgi:hypothetical protein
MHSNSRTNKKLDGSRLPLRQHDHPATQDTHTEAVMRNISIKKYVRLYVPIQGIFE